MNETDADERAIRLPDTDDIVATMDAIPEERLNEVVWIDDHDEAATEIE